MECEDKVAKKTNIPASPSAWITPQSPGRSPAVPSVCTVAALANEIGVKGLSFIRASTITRVVSALNGSNVWVRTYSASLCSYRLGEEG